MKQTDGTAPQIPFEIPERRWRYPRRWWSPGAALTLAALLAVAAFGAPAAAEDPASQPRSAPSMRVAAEPRIVGDELALTLEEAVQMALASNLDLVLERFNLERSRQQIPLNLGIYDLNLDASINLDETDQPTVSAFEGSQAAAAVTSESQSLNLGGSQLTPWGGVVSFGMDTTRNETTNIFSTFNPSFTVVPNVRFDQPLWRNFGRRINDHNIILAHKNSDISAEQFEQQVIDTVLTVENAYWDLVETIAQLEVSYESLDLSEKLHDQNKIQVDVGTLPPLELVRSEAGIATRQEEIIINQTLVGNAEDRLRQLLHVPQGRLWSLAILPETEPAAEAIEIDLDEAIKEALAHRSELEVQDIAIEREEIQVAFLENQEKPTLDLALSYRSVGLGGDAFFVDRVTGERVLISSGGLSDAFSSGFGNDFPGWTAGLTLSFPLQNRTAKAQTAIGRIDLAQAKGVRSQLEEQIFTEVRTAVREVESAIQQIESAGVSRRLQLKNLEAEQTRLENGMSTSFEVLLIQEDLSNAARREVSSVTNYRKRLASYHQATGTLLEKVGIVLASPESDLSQDDDSGS